MYEIKYRSPDEMKDSGVEWLGVIPREWNVTKLGYQTQMIVPMRDKPTSFGGDIPWIRIEDFDGKYIGRSKTNQKVSTNLIKKMNLKIYPIGTILCTCSCSLGTTAIVETEIISNQTFIGIVPQNNICSDYLYYLMNSCSERLQFLANGAIQQYLSRENFEKLKIQLPALAEQHKIANFLDVKTAQFDSIISKKELLIQKLEEAKKSLISEVVTGKVKIVDGQIVQRHPEEMKDSGVEWLGMIPKEWEVSKVKYYYDVQLGKMLQPSKKCKGDTLEKYLCTINVDWDNAKLDFVKEMWFSKAEKSKYLVKNGDLIVNEGGDAGKACIVTNTSYNIYIQNAVHRVRAKKQYTVKYLYYWLFVLKSIKYIDLLCNKATIMHFTNEKFNELFLPLPKGKEEFLYTNYLDDKVSHINGVIRLNTRLIQKLKQAKQSLISEAVTGKIDLRDWEIIEEGGVQ